MPTGLGRTACPVKCGDAQPVRYFPLPDNLLQPRPGKTPAKRFLAESPRARLAVLPGTSHIGMLARSQFIDVVTPFLDDEKPLTAASRSPPPRSTNRLIACSSCTPSASPMTTLGRVRPVWIAEFSAASQSPVEERPRRTELAAVTRQERRRSGPSPPSSPLPCPCRAAARAPQARGTSSPSPCACHRRAVRR